MTIHSISPSDDPVKIDGNEWKGKAIVPGDTLKIEAGKYTRISVRGLKGTQAKPILITNTGGSVITSIDENNYFPDCQWITIDGFGDMSEKEIADSEAKMRTGSVDGIDFGLQFRGRIMVVDRSLGFTIKHCRFFDNTSAAIFAAAVKVPTWEMNDMTVVYNYFQDLNRESANGEMVYMGNWNGNDSELLMRRIEIAFNIARNCTGGYQLRGAVTPQDGLIHHNWAFDCSNGPKEWGTIDVGANCAARVYNNWIEGGNGFGGHVSYQCRKNVEIFNNVFIYGGPYEGRRSAFRQGSNDGGRIDIFNNTIIGGDDHGLDITSKHSKTFMWNNIIVGSPNPIDPGGSPLSNFRNNLIGPPSVAQFVGDGDYRLKADSPAFQAGAPEAPEFDFDGKPQTSPPTIGAFALAAGVPTPVPDPEPEPEPEPVTRIEFDALTIALNKISRDLEGLKQFLRNLNPPNGE